MYAYIHAFIYICVYVYTYKMYAYAYICVDISDISFKKTFCLINIRPQDLLSHEPALLVEAHHLSEATNCHKVFE